MEGSAMSKLCPGETAVGAHSPLLTSRLRRSRMMAVNWCTGVAGSRADHNVIIWYCNDVIYHISSIITTSMAE